MAPAQRTSPPSNQPTSAQAGKSRSNSKKTRISRSRSGCWTCRGIKVKCDEIQPRCGRCDRLDLDCDFAPRPRKKYTRRSTAATAPHTHDSTEVGSPSTRATSNSTIATVITVASTDRTCTTNYAPSAARAREHSESPSGLSLSHDSSTHVAAPDVPDPGEEVDDTSEGGALSFVQNDSVHQQTVQQDLPGQNGVPARDRGSGKTTPASNTLSLQEVLDSKPADTELLASVAPDVNLILSESDIAAIIFFRFIFSSAVDSKQPHYSGPAIVWTLATTSPMVMHSVCALAGRSLCEKLGVNLDLDSTPGRDRDRDQKDADLRYSVAVHHYTAGLRLLHEALRDCTQAKSFNCVLATLWLMIGYEQRYGDGCCTGLNAHLHGAASLFRDRLRNLKEAFMKDKSRANDLGSSSDGMMDIDHLQTSVSPTTCQLLVWIALVDSGAALNGIGGSFNRVLGESLLGSASESPELRLRAFLALQARADLANAEVWGSGFPQSELVEDLQNSQVLGLQAESGQLRYLLSRLATNPPLAVTSTLTPAVTDWTSSPSISTSLPAYSPAEGEIVDTCIPVSLGNAIHDVQARYHGILRTATMLRISEMESPGQVRFVSNVRYIVAFYHAIVLCHLRHLHGPNRTMLPPQHEALRNIMLLASQAHRDHGEAAMTRFAWPLFVAALESNDMIHRDWILERYEHLAQGGENFRRARRALVMVGSSNVGNQVVDYLELVQRESTSRFVL